jgi:hypothetical protein
MAEPTRVGDLLASFPGMAERLAHARLLRAWPEIAGPAADRTAALGVEGGVLQVAVHSSAWLHRLTLDERRLVERCRAIADVRAIRFRLASVARPPTSAASSAEPPAAGSAAGAGYDDGEGLS